jgi:hypothetical protein
MTLTGTAINFPKLMHEVSAVLNFIGDSPMYTRQEFDNIPQLADPIILGNVFLMIGSDNYASGKMTMFSDKTFSFDLYLGDDLLGTYTKSLLGSSNR